MRSVKKAPNFLLISKALRKKGGKFFSKKFLIIEV
jgi:hypothetical protein